MQIRVVSIALQLENHVFKSDRVFFFKEITKRNDKDSAVGIVYMDSLKALDKDPRGKLVWKVRLHGI